jgi:hypothetical protein
MDNGLFRAGPGGLAFLPGRQEYGKAAICRIVFRPIAPAQAAAN